MFKYILSAAFILTLLVTGCKKKSEDYAAKSYEYYPYTVKSERTYRLDSTLYALDTIIKKSKIILEIVTEQFSDLQGQTAYRLEQYIIPDSGKNQIFFDLQTTNWNEQGVQRVENNQRYLKMVFPIRDKKQWNGNMYNNINQQMYQFTGTFQPITIDTKTYTDVVTVTQRYEVDDLIGHHEDKEIYAKNIGMVYRLNRHLDLDQTQGKETGYEAVWTLINFRK